MHLTIYDTDPIFPVVLALLTGATAAQSSTGGPDARAASSAAGPKPAALPPDPLPPADTADLPTVVVAPSVAAGGTQRGPAARSGTRPATVGPGKSKGGPPTLLLLAEPAATPPNAPPLSGKDNAPAAGGGDAQCGTVGTVGAGIADAPASSPPSASDAGPVVGAASSEADPLPPDSAADTAPGTCTGRTGAVESGESPEARAVAAVAASPVVARVVAATRGRVEHVEAAPSLLETPQAPPKRPAARGPRSSSSASKDAPASPEGWILSESALQAAEF